MGEKIRYKCIVIVSDSEEGGKGERKVDRKKSEVGQRTEDAYFEGLAE